MEQLIEKQRSNSAVKSTPSNVALSYLVLALAPIVLKLLGLVAWPWSKVTFTIWAPWLLVAVVSFIGWVVYLVQTRRG